MSDKKVTKVSAKILIMIGCIVGANLIEMAYTHTYGAVDGARHLNTFIMTWLLFTLLTEGTWGR